MSTSRSAADDVATTSKTIVQQEKKENFQVSKTQPHTVVIDDEGDIQKAVWLYEKTVALMPESSNNDSRMKAAQQRKILQQTHSSYHQQNDGRWVEATNKTRQQKKSRSHSSWS